MIGLLETKAASKGRSASRAAVNMLRTTRVAVSGTRGKILALVVSALYVHVSSHEGDACVPLSMIACHYACGNVSDGCGSELWCGDCPPGTECRHSVCACDPKSCVEAGKNCGMFDTSPAPGCGTTVYCGAAATAAAVALAAAAGSLLEPCGARQTCIDNVYAIHMRSFVLRHWPDPTDNLPDVFPFADVSACHIRAAS